MLAGTAWLLPARGSWLDEIFSGVTEGLAVGAGIYCLDNRCLDNYLGSMPARISSLEDHLGYWLRILSNAVSASFARRIEAHGVSVAQWVVLRLLHDCRGCTLASLSAALGTDKGAVSRMIDRLLKLGLVRREASAVSRRQVALSLTPRAMTLVPKLARAADENDHAFFGALDRRQRAEFSRLVKLLVAARVEGGAKPPLQ